MQNNSTGNSSVRKLTKADTSMKEKLTPHEDERVSVRHSLPSISLTTKERALLVYMQNLRDERLNIKAYSRHSGVPRPTVYYYCEKLTMVSLVSCSDGDLKDYRITKLGITALEVSDGVTSIGNSSVRNLRRECRDKSVNLSTHYLKYSLEIKEKNEYYESRLMELNPLKIKPLKLKNQKGHYLYFEDATIIINPKTLIVRVKDIIAEDTEEAHFESFNTAVVYFEKLEKIGLKGETIELEPAHYARIDSLLAEFLEKIDKRYFLDLGNGRKFWIDHSKPNRIEDETNDHVIRGRVDKVMTDICENDIELLDIDKIVNALGFLTKIEAEKLRREMGPINQKDIIPKEQPSYFG